MTTGGGSQGNEADGAVAKGPIHALVNKCLQERKKTTPAITADGEVSFMKAGRLFLFWV